MSMSVGTVIVAQNGSRTGSGMALAVYDGIITAQSLNFPDPNTPASAFGLSTVPPSWYTLGANIWAGLTLGQQWSAIINHALFNMKSDIARTAVGIASGLVPYIAANAVVTTQVAVGGLQKTPNPNNPATATDAPAVAVNLSGMIA